MPPAAMTYSNLLYVIAAGGIVELQAMHAPNILTVERGGA